MGLIVTTIIEFCPPGPGPGYMVIFKLDHVPTLEDIAAWASVHYFPFALTMPRAVWSEDEDLQGKGGIILDGSCVMGIRLVSTDAGD